MKLENYISDLLFRYECVIVPDFGGFITKEISAVIDEEKHTFYPPKKELSFNGLLKNNDGLLANYIVSVENVSYTDALLSINNAVENWKQRLKQEVITLQKIGILSLNANGGISFEPSSSENYLTSSFGLSTYTSQLITRDGNNKIIPLHETKDKVMTETTTKSKKKPVFLKYAATAAILLLLGGVAWNTYNEKQYQDQLAAEQALQESVTQKIQEATFVIESPLPSITLEVQKEEVNYNYFIIAGAFREHANAEKKVNQLHNLGFENAEIIGTNRWNLTQVAFSGYSTREEAIESLQIIKKTQSSDAWLLVK